MGWRGQRGESWVRVRDVFICMDLKVWGDGIMEGLLFEEDTTRWENDRHGRIWQ